MFRLTFLGTSSGMPTKYRNVSGLALECCNPYKSNQPRNKTDNRPWLLVDCGEGTQHQILKTKLSVNQLSAICITHVHGDHCYGLPGLLSSMALSGRKSPLKIIAPKPIAKLLDTLTITTQLYFPYDIEFIGIEDLLSHSQGYTTITVSNNHQLDIHIEALSHRVDSFAFSITQTIEHQVLDTKKLLSNGIEAGPIWGKLKYGVDHILENGQVLKAAEFINSQSEKIKVVISGDNDNPQLLKHAITDASLLVHEATYTQAVADRIHARKEGINPQHSTAKQVAEFAEDVQLANLILTHFSARYQPFYDIESKQDNMAHIREEVEENCQYFSSQFERKFWLAEDFDCFEVTAFKVKKISQ